MQLPPGRGRVDQSKLVMGAGWNWPVAVLGIVLFVVSATLPEAFTNFLPRGSGFMMLELLLEEIGEMAGITIVLWGVYELLIAHRVSVRFHSPAVARSREPSDGAQKPLPVAKQTSERRLPTS